MKLNNEHIRRLQAVIDAHESRVRIAGEEDSPYASLDLDVDPAPPQEEGQGGEPDGSVEGRPDDEAEPKVNPEAVA